MQAHTSTSPKKPSPLSFGSPRPSPFKRPDSPLIRSPSTVRPAGPALSPIKPPTFSILPAQPVSATPVGPSAPVPQPLPAQVVNRNAAAVTVTAPQSISRTLPVPQGDGSNNSNDALSRLHPAQLRDLRESFQVLDRDNDGRVTREDVAEVLTQLGLDASPTSLHPYFPSNSASLLTLPSYLSPLSTLLASFSPEPELAAAFAAFDVDDSGQIDVDDLRDALLHRYPDGGSSTARAALTAPEIDGVMDAFRGRRALAKGMFGKEASRRGDVFRYREFMGTISGADREEQGNKAAAVVKA